MDYKVRTLQETDLPEWVRLRLALWPDGDSEELSEEMPAYLPDGDRRLIALVAELDNTNLIGLLEGSLRMQAEGCMGSPVAYLEALYVDEEYRRKGIATSLIEQFEKWARQHGICEVASDSLIDNSLGHTVHEALGFEEVERLVHFVKELPAEG